MNSFNRIDPKSKCTAKMFLLASSMLVSAVANAVIVTPDLEVITVPNVGASFQTVNLQNTYTSTIRSDGFKYEARTVLSDGANGSAAGWNLSLTENGDLLKVMIAKPAMMPTGAQSW